MASPPDVHQLGAGFAWEPNDARRLGQRTRRTLAGRAALRPDAVGDLVHRAIGLHLVSGHLSLAAVVDATVGQGRAPVHRLALRHRIKLAVAVYDRDFRRASQWNLLGAELHADDVRLDLLYIDSSGRMEADEVKTGQVGPARQIPRTRTQISAQIDAALAAFGPRFAGVRLVDLAYRQATFIGADRRG